MDKAELEANEATRDHIAVVQRMLTIVVIQLMQRSHAHDCSKLNPPEREVFAEYTPKLKGTTYGSDEYKQYLKEMQVALDHHYSMNSHHPEHHHFGVNDMDLIDLVEMFCDWKAATLRHDDGDIMKSIDINAKRFSLDPQLVSILKNTVGLFGGVR